MLSKPRSTSQTNKKHIHFAKSKARHASKLPNIHRKVFLAAETLPWSKINQLIKTYLVFRVFQKLPTVQSTQSTPYLIKWLLVLNEVNLTELSEHVTRGNFGLPTDTYHRMEPCGIPPGSHRAKRFYYATLYVRCQMLFVTFKPELYLLLNSRERIIWQKQAKKWNVISLHQIITPMQIWFYIKQA